MLEAARHGLLPREIEDLAPYELALVLRGRRERDRDHLRQTAWLVATMQNAWQNASTTPAQLLGEAPPQPEGTSEAAVADAIDAVDAARALKRSRGWFERVSAAPPPRLRDREDAS